MKQIIKRKQFAVNRRRVIVIHNHVFKNAGSTIDWALRRNFGNDFVDHRDDKYMQRGPEYLGKYLLKNPTIRALSTHHLRPPLPLLENVKLMTIMMFRHPIERVTSVYNFERKQNQANTLGARYARKHSLREYVLWRMRFDIPPTIRNFHIFRTLPGKVCWQEVAGDAELKMAKAYVDSLDMLGFVERFDESMILFEKSLGDIFPPIDLSYKMQNVGQDPREPLVIRIERLRENIGDETFKLLIDYNRADLELYNYARRIFEVRLCQINDLEKKRDDFHKRCQRKLRTQET